MAESKMSRIQEINTNGIKDASVYIFNVFEWSFGFYLQIFLDSEQENWNVLNISNFHVQLWLDKIDFSKDFISSDIYIYASDFY